MILVEDRLLLVVQKAQFDFRLRFRLGWHLDRTGNERPHGHHQIGG